MSEKQHVAPDHWWSSPLTLTPAEINDVVRASSRLIGHELQWLGRVEGGRSGAALHVLGRRRPEIFARVTSCRRAMRERYIVTVLDAASPLRIDGVLPIVALPTVRRTYAVS